jgi:hypothetical protein
LRTGYRLERVEFKEVPVSVRDRGLRKHL